MNIYKIDKLNVPLLCSQGPFPLIIPLTMSITGPHNPVYSASKTLSRDVINTYFQVYTDPLIPII